MIKRSSIWSYWIDRELSLDIFDNLSREIKIFQKALQINRLKILFLCLSPKGQKGLEEKTGLKEEVYIII